jgi:hypothetical protein
MSNDVRVPVEKEYDNPRRRPGAGGFSELLAGRSCSAGSATGPFSLMSEFLDKAFEGDGKLDQNELEGMKVLAGLVPGHGRPQPHEAQAPCRPEPPKCEPEPSRAPMCAEDFMQEVGKLVVQSRGCAGSEGKAIDQAARLMNAKFEQQAVFLRMLQDMVRSHGRINDEEANQLASAVDCMLGRHSTRPVQDTPRTPPAPQPSASPAPTIAFDPSTTQAARRSDWLNELVASGGISYETAMRAMNHRPS